MPTLHVRCGSDIRLVLAEARLEGDFLEYSDPVCQGPTPSGLPEAEFREVRARFIADNYGLSIGEARRRLEREASGLAAAGDYERIVLWFEHDLYDQTVLARLLDHFAARPELHSRLWLVCIDGFPGVARFRGLGDLTPAQLAAAGDGAVPVTAPMLDSGRRAWAAFTADDPSSLASLVREGTPALPLMGVALRRHLQEFPWVGTGLSLTERLILEAVAAGCDTPGRAFGHLQDAEVTPWLGDLMLWPIVARLGEGAFPALSPFAGPREPVRLTDTGRALLAGESDWVALNGLDRWVGGVRLEGRRAHWRYDQKADVLIVLESD